MDLNVALSVLFRRRFPTLLCPISVSKRLEREDSQAGCRVRSDQCPAPFGNRKKSEYGKVETRAR